MDYFILRVCERLHLREVDFRELPYAEQIRLLVYQRLRLLEETLPPVA